MNRTEKNQRTKGIILNGALAEFSAHGYEAASLNTICAKEQISKGSIYHYFSSKDDLYLACVEQCFDSLTDYLRTNLPDQKSGEELLKAYFDLRMQYFRDHEETARLFCCAVVFPPEHLKREIQKCRRAFDELNDEYFRKILKQSRIREDLNEGDILREFRFLQDYFNARFQSSTESELNIEQHEKDCWNLLDMFLYGIIAREPTE